MPCMRNPARQMPCVRNPARQVTAQPFTTDDMSAERVSECAIRAIETGQGGSWQRSVIVRHM